MEATEESYKRKPVFQWEWKHWLATVITMTVFASLFVVGVADWAGATSPFRILLRALLIAPLPLACFLFGWWYKAQQATEESFKTTPVEVQEPVTVVEEREPILYQPYAPKQLEAPNTLTPEVLVLIIKELWEYGKLSRRAVMGLRLPGGQTISKRMWQRLIGGYRDVQGREKPGLLAEIGLITRTNDRSWQWREGLTLEDVMNCFQWDTPQIESPNTPEDLGRAGRAGQNLGKGGPPTPAGRTLVERHRLARLYDLNHSVQSYLEKKR